MPEERLPEAVEVAAYYVASEALANAAQVRRGERRDRSRRAQRRARDRRDRGRRRGGATIAGGSGLRGLSDRVETLGGRLTIISPPGRGTVVRAEIPVAGQS